MHESVPTRAIRKARRTWAKFRFEKTAARVLTTARLSVRGDSPVFLSQLCHRDVAAYLLAIKSLYRGVGQGRVMVINDGSLTGDDISILAHHIPGIEFVDIATIDTGSCPRGGTWERLVKIIELSHKHYVIQADADTLVSGPIPEVAECWRSNLSFLLGSDCGQEVAPAVATARLAQGWVKNFGWDTIGVLSEALLDGLPPTAPSSYVHASSGFGGFAKGGFRFADLEFFSDWMRAKLGEGWDKWGTEQIASNYMIANAPGAIVLPFSRYASFEPHVPPGDRPFLHFIGTYRYGGGVYRERARQFLRKYKSNSRRG
jgi:hypothetical protein